MEVELARRKLLRELDDTQYSIITEQWGYIKEYMRMIIQSGGGDIPKLVDGMIDRIYAIGAVRILSVRDSTFRNTKNISVCNAETMV